MLVGRLVSPRLLRDDFHMAGPDSVITFEPRAGGQLLETRGEDSLLWCSVHMILNSQRTVYLVGNLAPDWGGPSTSCLKIQVEETADGCVLKAHDSHFGHVDDTNIKNMEEGWMALFSDGLKKHVEGSC